MFKSPLLFLNRVPLLEAEGLVSRYMRSNLKSGQQKVSKREFPYTFERGIHNPFLKQRNYRSYDNNTAVE